MDLADRLERERVAQRELVAGRPRPRRSGIRAFACDVEVPGPEDRPRLHAEEVRVVRDRQLGRHQPGSLRVDRQTRPLERDAQLCSRDHRCCATAVTRDFDGTPRELERPLAAVCIDRVRGRLREQDPCLPRCVLLEIAAAAVSSATAAAGEPASAIASASSRTPWTGARSRSKRRLSIAGS